ncbi:dienelactone hydrolase family protein [Streptacidiphilus albus]|uniref:dienelactone hydrolase family protein n=1 Tax=Streptacidiphilus albus TaxID=105425 RepID=UPI0005AA8DF6|nr:dienelactone hydrolase family protein [Streptacidiphilus albus]
MTTNSHLQESPAAAPVAVRSERVVIPLDDGSSMGGYLARPSVEGDLPGVVVAMELFGVDAGVRGVCDRLAALGFVALAPDFHHRTSPDVELPRDEAGRQRGFELLHRMSRPQLLVDARAAADHLHRLGCERLNMVGMSLGGHIACLAATQIDFEVVVSFYGGWLATTDIPLSRPEPTLALTPRITGRVLYLIGEEDHVVPPDQQREIETALREADGGHQYVSYPGVGHGFLTADPETAADAWARAERLLTEGRSAS